MEPSGSTVNMAGDRNFLFFFPWLIRVKMVMIALSGEDIRQNELNFWVVSRVRAMDAERMPVVLVVEDNEDNRELVIKVLSRRGFRVVGVETGQEALNSLATVAPDVILMDINLPGMDGYEVTRRIRELAGFSSVPIIALTAHAMRGDEAKSLAAGCDAYIAKPVDVRLLPDQVAAVMDKKRHYC